LLTGAVDSPKINSAPDGQDFLWVVPEALNYGLQEACARALAQCREEAVESWSGSDCVCVRRRMYRNQQRKKSSGRIDLTLANARSAQSRDGRLNETRAVTALLGGRSLLKRIAQIRGREIFSSWMVRFGTAFYPNSLRRRTILFSRSLNRT